MCDLYPVQVKDAEIESLLEERERLDAALQSIKGQIQLAASPQSRPQELGASRAPLNVPTLRHVWLLLSVRKGPGTPGLPAAPRGALQTGLTHAALQDVRVVLHGTQLPLQLPCCLLAYLPTTNVPAQTWIQATICRGLHQALEDAQGSHTKAGSSRVAPASSQRSSATHLQPAAPEASLATASEHQGENVPSPSPQQVSPSTWCMQWGWWGLGRGFGVMCILSLQLLLSVRGHCAMSHLVTVLPVRFAPGQGGAHADQYPKRWLCTGRQSVPCLPGCRCRCSRSQGRVQLWGSRHPVAWQQRCSPSPPQAWRPCSTLAAPRPPVHCTTCWLAAQIPPGLALPALFQHV